MGAQMEIKEITLKKLNKQELTFDEIKFAVMNYVHGKINKEDMTAFLKAIYNNGMTEQETFDLTKIMTCSGDTISFNDGEIYADKHSTGGISDITTLVVIPIVAAAGIKVFKMSGRKLGFTGGTVDKLECFNGYKAAISIKKAKELVKKNGAVVMSFTKDLTPADAAIYKLRDETNTIMSLPLIASSVMSKKLAGGSNVIVLDVKCGNGAFMKKEKAAIELAKVMLKIGKMAGKKIAAVISDMNQPLGHSIGSLVESIEAVKLLKGEIQDERLKYISIYLSAKIIELSKEIPFEEAQAIASDILNSGKALQKFKDIITAQGGSLDLFDNNYVDKILKNSVLIKAPKEGYVSKFDLEKLGTLTREYCALGNSGIKVLVNLGDYIKKGTPIIELYGKATDFDFASCVHCSKTKKIANKLIIDVL